jgi:hypothetical protein
MRIHAWFVAGVICTALLAQAQTPDRQEGTCPAHRAAEAGHNTFEAFHRVMAPAWHEAWPNEDYEALFEAGPKFLEAFQAVSEMTPEFKTENRAEQFSKAREDLGLILATYAAACDARDSAKVYELMPQVHDAFERTASTLLRVPYPEIDGLAITTRLIIDTHLPKGNMEGISGSTETLVRKCEVINEATIPPEIADQKEAILKDLAGIRKVIMKMQQCCKANDMESYAKNADTLDAELTAFINKYL